MIGIAAGVVAVGLVLVAGNKMYMSDYGLRWNPVKDFVIISKKWGDMTGRTVIYRDKKESLFGGQGFLHAGYTDVPWGVVGVFDHFEPIQQSSDEVIFIQTKDGSFIKGRIIFSGNRDETDFRLENLTKSYPQAYEIIGRLINGKLSKEKINGFFKKGDIVAIVISPDEQHQLGKESLNAEPQNVVRVVLRRFYSVGHLLTEVKSK